MADNVVEVYEAPSLAVLGTLSELTMGGSGGHGLDLILGIGSLLDVFVHLGL